MKQILFAKLVYVSCLFIWVFYPAAGQPLIPAGATWKYLDNGSDQGTAWRMPGFDDSSWQSGPAQLGYGDGDEATVVSYGGNMFNKYITTYFRHTFHVNDPAVYPSLLLRLLRDDGAVVYINGTEVWRSNMPSGTITYQTTASSVVSGSDEDAWHEKTVSSAYLVQGANVVAVEIHQDNPLSSDISFDFEMLPGNPPAVRRGPYLQVGTPASVIVRWRTDIAVNSVVWVGQDTASLTMVFADSTLTTEHEVKVYGLTPATKYYYAIGYDNQRLAGGIPDYHFITSPVDGSTPKIRIWALGDCGTANNNQRAVRDAYYNYVGNRHTDMILLLGDNAYNDGTDAEYQQAIFENMYEDKLINTVMWSCPGNHDIHSASSSSQTGPYYDIFTFPMQGEAGGLPSGTEAYYSFNYGNIHFISLDSEDSDRSTTGDMYTWLQNDLAANTLPWIIAFWHHPPYTKGSHDSDIWLDSFGRMVDMRQNFLPLLEAYGVDLVLTGHSHSYERSYLLNGHYGYSWDLNPGTMIVDNGSGRLNTTDCAYAKKTYGAGAGKGAVYVVTGSAGKTSGGALNHPVMFTSLNQLGSTIVEVEENRLDLKFIDNNGNISDYFALFKNLPDTAHILHVQYGDTVELKAFWPGGDYHWQPGNDTTRGIAVVAWQTMEYIVTNGNGCLSDTFRIYVDSICEAPENLMAVNRAIDPVRLSWDPVPGASGYQIRGRKIGVASYTYLTVQGGQTTFKDLQINSPANTFEWEVRAVCPFGNSAYAGPDTFSMADGICELPDSLWVGPLTPNAVRLNWLPVNGAAQYVIKGRVQGGTGAAYAYAPGTSTHRDVYGLNPQTTYEWQLRVVCTPAGVSPWSTVQAFTTPPQAGDNRLAGRQKGVGNEGSDHWLFVIPNPSDGNFRLAGSNLLDAQAHIEVYDVTGKRVWQASVQPHADEDVRIQLSGTGLYFIRITSESFVKTMKVLVE